MNTILHINSSKSWRGGEQQLAYLLENKLVNHVVLCKKNSALEQYCKSEKVVHFIFKNKIDFCLELKKIIKNQSIDIIHLHDSESHTKWYIWKLISNNKIPVVLHRRVAFAKHKNYFSSKKYNDSNIKKIICISETVKQETAKIINDKNKLEIIYSGIKINNETQQTTSNEIPIIVTVSALTEEKNLFEFIDIASEYLKHKQAYFYIFGEGKLEQDLHNYIHKKNVQNHVFLKGFVKDINQQLQQFDLFLFTSKSEGLGTSILDAMNAKIPVVTNNFAATKEIIEHEKTGYIYKDVSDAVSIIDKLLTIHDSRLTTTQNAFNFVQNFDVTLMNQKMQNIYSSLNVHH